MRYTFVILFFIFGCAKQSDTDNEQITAKVRYYNTKYNEYQRVNINIAQTYIDSIQTLSKKENYVKGIGIATLDKGLLENIKGNFNLAINKNEKALSIFNELKEDTLIAKSLAALGVNYWQKGEIVKSLDFLFKALKINETLDLKSAQAANYNQISMVYQSQNKIPLAEEFANKSMKIIQNLTPELSHISTFHNLANIYGMQGKYKDALRLDSIGLIYCEQLNAEFNKSMFYDNMANCLYYANDWTNAINYHLKAISIDSSFGNNKQLGDTYCNMGAIYEEQKNYDKALECYNKSIELCRVSGYKIGIKNGLQQLSKLFYKTNNTTAAYHLLQESMIVKDSMINESSEQKIAELQTLFDTEKKKQQIAQQELKISRRNILLVVLLAALIMSVFIFRLVYLRYKLKQEQKLQQELIKEETKRSKAIIETEENERQRLARELHDGVGQLLTATKLNLANLKNTENTTASIQHSMNILDESIQEIRTLSHNMVPDVLHQFGLEKAVTIFANKMQSTATEIQVFFSGYQENMLDDISKLMLYRIIQECVNNAVKYASATQITLQITADEKEITLMVEDNGIGFDKEIISSKNGIGMKNLELRSAYLKGHLDIESSLGNGTTIIVDIPIKQ